MGEAQEAAARPREAAPVENDDELHDVIVRARAGEVEAWARLYHEHYEDLYLHLGFMTSDPALAEDLTQEVFARAFVALGRFEGRSRFATWLYGISSNVVRDHWRKQRRQRRAYAQLSTNEVDDALSPEDTHDVKQKTRALARALEGLPDRYREAFVLVALRELSTAQAAEILGISPSNVSVRVHRARKRIHRKLTRRGWFGGRSP